MAGARAQTEVMLQARALFHLERVALSLAREKHRQLVRRDDFQLIEGALLRLLVEPPAAKLRCVAKPCPLHMVISDLDHQLRTKRLPSEILALAPAAQTARTPLTALVVQGPIFNSLLRQTARWSKGDSNSQSRPPSSVRLELLFRRQGQ